MSRFKVPAGFNKLTTKKFVKIAPDRGYGKGMYEVVAENANTYQLRDIKGDSSTTFPMYKAHCYEDLDTKKYGVKS